jgi:hypothetical protein
MGTSGLSSKTGGAKVKTEEGVVGSALRLKLLLLTGRMLLMGVFAGVGATSSPGVLGILCKLYSSAVSTLLRTGGGTVAF